MSKIHGHDGVIRVGGTDTIGHLQSWNLDPQAQMTAGYSMGEEWESNRATVKRWSGSAEAYFDPADAGQISLEPGDVVTLDLYPGGDASGATYRSGTAVVSGTPISANKDGWVSITFNFVGDGALTTNTVV